MNKTSQDTTHSNLLLVLSSATAEYEYPAKDKNTTRKSCVFISNDFLFSYEITTSSLERECSWEKSESIMMKRY